MSTQKVAVKKCKIISVGMKTNKKHSDTRSFCYVAFTLWSKLPDTPKMQKTLHLFSSSWNRIVYNSSVAYQLPNPPDQICFSTVPPASLSSWNFPPLTPSLPLPVHLCQAEWACGCLCGVKLHSTYNWTLTLIYWVQYGTWQACY